MKSERGLIKLFLLLTLVFCGAIFLLFIIGRGGYSFPQVSNTNYSNSSGSYSNSTQNPLLPQPYSGGSSSGGGFLGGTSLSIGFGNSTYETQPFSEYITIHNNTSAPIDITGYTLTNSKGTRPVETLQNQNITNISPDKSVIPQGTKYLTPTGRYTLQDIVLAGGATAYVITGGPFATYSIPISVSFQDNKCEGYFNKIYPFTPYLSNSCPRPETEEGAGSVSIQCYDYMKTIYTCQDAKRDDKIRHDAQTTICQAFLDTTTNYQGCYDIHSLDSDFLQKDWRIFLGRKTEMWASRDESIRLYDRAGKLVTQVSY